MVIRTLSLSNIEFNGKINALNSHYSKLKYAINHAKPFRSKEIKKLFGNLQTQ